MAEPVASDFSRVHAIIRVDKDHRNINTAAATAYGTGNSGGGRGGVGAGASFQGGGIDYGGSGAFTVSVFDNHFATTSSSSSSTSSTFSKKRQKHGVWILGFDGLRPAPKPTEVGNVVIW